MDLSIVKVALWNMKRTCHGMFHTGIQKYLLSAIKVMRKFIKWCVSDCNNTYKNANHYKTLIDFSFCSYCTVFGTVVTNMTFSSVKPSISPSNLALHANPGTVLKSARPEGSKTLSTCLNWLSFDWDICDQRQMIGFKKIPVNW